MQEQRLSKNKINVCQLFPPAGLPACICLCLSVCRAFHVDNSDKVVMEEEGGQGGEG